jgi:hypothetical protein
MLTIFSGIRKAKGRKNWLRLALAGFLVRALIPVGFMPAPLASGSPVMVCHGGLAGAFFEALAEKSRGNAMPADMADDSAMSGHAHSDHPSTADEPPRYLSAWDHCPNGANASAAALAPSFAFSLLALSQRPSDPEPHSGVPAGPISFYQARAPPPNLVLPLS